MGLLDEVPDSIKRKITGALLILGAIGWFAAAYFGGCQAKGQDLPDLWSHVYRPSRLTIHQGKVAVTGVIVDATAGKRKDGVRREVDGDCHGWLKLDAGQEQYLNAGNLSDEGGNLVFEVVCMFPVRQPDAVSACKGYKNAIQVPPVGSYVRMTGSWVMDDNHAHWNEIHPVSSIELIPHER